MKNKQLTLTRFHLPRPSLSTLYKGKKVSTTIYKIKKSSCWLVGQSDRVRSKKKKLKLQQIAKIVTKLNSNCDTQNATTHNLLKHLTF